MISTCGRCGASLNSFDGACPKCAGGKTCLGPITKAGDRYLRQLLVIAGAGLIRRVKADPTLSPWLAGLLQRMPAKKAAIAVANKLARIVWAMLVRGETYKTPATA